MRSIFKTAVLAAGATVVSVALVGCGGAAGPANSASTQAAENYPTKTVRFLVPFGAGGPTDIMSRAVANCFSKDFGQSFVVENKGGGGGALAMQEVIAAKPDGYTLSLATLGTLILTPMANKLDYSKDDVTPIGRMAEVPSYIVVGKDSPYKSAADLFAAAKAAPGKLKFALSSATGPQAIELKRLKDEYGIDITVVPFKSNTEQTTALLGGHVDGVFINDAQDVGARIDDGSFKPLAVSSEKRQSYLPDVPTLVELGFPKLTGAVSTYGLIGPKGLPESVVNTLSDGLEKCLQKQDVITKIGDRFIPKTYGDGKTLQKIEDDAQEVYAPILAK